MPGKHAPDSPRSFYLSLARAGTGALAALGLVVAIVVVAVTSRGTDAGTPQARTEPTVSQTPTRGTVQPSVAPSTPEPEPEPSPLRKRARLTVDVLNGTDVAGLAGGTAERLQEQGYRRVESDDAAEKPQARTAIYYAKGFKREAQRLLREFPELLTVRSGDRPSPGDAQIVVVLGEDYEAP